MVEAAEVLITMLVMERNDYCLVGRWCGSGHDGGGYNGPGYGICEKK